MVKATKEQTKKNTKISINPRDIADPSIMVVLCSLKLPPEHEARKVILSLPENKAIELLGSIAEKNKVVKYKRKSYSIGSVLFWQDEIIKYGSERYSHFVRQMYLDRAQVPK